MVLTEDFMYRTAEQTAILIALLFKHANAKRARVSERTVRVLSKRKSLRTAFIEGLNRALDDLGLHIIELERGGFGLIPISALDGAQVILAKDHIAEQLKTIRQHEKAGRSEKAFAQFRAELTDDDESDADEE